MKDQDQNVLETIKSREIVQEIMDFGVTQHQIKKIIKFLSLELEDMTMTKSIVSLLEGEEQETKPKIQL